MNAVRALIGALCHIPAGEFIYGERIMTLPAFAISKYPITNEQFQRFMSAEDGYSRDRWWDGLALDREHREQSEPSRWSEADHPRERVSWYEAMAFCRWLSHHAGGSIELDDITAWASSRRFHQLLPCEAGNRPVRCRAAIQPRRWARSLSCATSARS